MRYIESTDQQVTCEKYNFIYKLQLIKIFFWSSATVTEIVKSDKNPSGKIFDLTAGIVFDGLTGQAAGQAFGPDAKQIASNLLNIHSASIYN